MQEVIWKAMKCVGGGRKGLARVLKLSSTKPITQWIAGTHKLPLRHAIGIYYVTKKQVTLQEMAIYMNPDDVVFISQQTEQAIDAFCQQPLEGIAERVQVIANQQQKKRKKGCKKSCARNSEPLFYQMGFKNKFAYYKGKSVLEHGIPELAKAIDHNQLSLSSGALVSRLPKQAQADFLLQDKKTQRQILRGLKHKTNSGLAPMLCIKPVVNYRDFLTSNNNLDSTCSFTKRLVIAIVLKQIAGSHQGKRSDLSYYSKNNSTGKQKLDIKTFLDEVSPVIMRSHRFLDEVTLILDEVNAHSEAIKAYLAEVPGRLDCFIAKKCGFGSKDRLNQAIFIGCYAESTLLDRLDAGTISIFNAYQQARAKQPYSINNNHKEEKQ